MSDPATDSQDSCWPPRLSLMGVPVSCTDYDRTVSSILAAARGCRPALVTAFDSRGVVIASEDPVYREQIHDFDLIAPDGQPVRLALNFLHQAGMRERVCGPEILPRLCEAAAKADVGVYLYGSTTATVTRLRDALVRRCAGLSVVGCEPSVFRPLTANEDRELVERIRRSGAGIVFLGLGCPLQETFAYEHRHSIRAVQVCVGAAFDFVAGTKRRAPRWMQDHALEWLYRIIHEPRRLLKRYVVYSPKFVVRVLLQAAASRSSELPVDGMATDRRW